ncbi:MAG: hypothetical protein QNI90_12805 [Dinoroseobacter sp.]|nr:hypothetical protein [Dinoroseobacter sp.]
MRLSDDLGVPFYCAWSESKGVGQTFNDPTELFEPQFVKTHFLSREHWSEIRQSSERLTGKLQQNPKEIRKTLSNGRHVIVGNAFGVIELAGEETEPVAQRFRAQLNRLPFAAPVSEALEALEEKLAHYTAYHIRRGDLTDDPKAMHKPWPHKVVPNEFYEFHMRDTLASPSGEGGALLFSDDMSAIGHYRGQFPQLKCLPDIAVLDGLTEAQRDLVELLAMSFCKKIIAPDQSAFSSTAADLSGAEKVAVAQDLTPTQQDAAYSALFHRLRDRPESFGGDGHIGQALAHIGPWLEHSGRIDEAARLFGARVADGLCISFVYPKTMRLQQLNDAPQEVLSTAAHMAKRPAIHIADHSAAEVLHGYAHLRLGDKAQGIKHILNGYWHGPAGALSKMIVPYLVETGTLSPAVFLPVSQLQLSLNRRRAPYRRLQTEFPALCAASCGPLDSLGSMETVTWDWAPLMRAVSFKSLQRQTALKDQRALLSKARIAERDVSERDSLGAILSAYEGETQHAIDELKRLSVRHENDVMVWQRLSHAYWITRDFKKAAHAAGEAVIRKPEWPVLQIWLAMVYLRTRNYADADALLSEVTLEGLPSLHALKAEAARRMGRPYDALLEIERATELAPLQADFAMVAAGLLSEANAPEQAIAHLHRIVAVHRAPGKLLLQLIELQQNASDLDGARKTASLALERAPNHAELESIAREILASRS